MGRDLAGQRHEGKPLNGQKPTFDAFGREYARIAFGIERHAPGFIDAYLGPDDVRAEIDHEPAPSPDELVEAANTLQAQVPELGASETREGYLTQASHGDAGDGPRRLAGEELPYREEVRLLYDIEPETTPEATFEAAIADLDRLLPGDGAVSRADDCLPSLIRGLARGRSQPRRRHPARAETTHECHRRTCPMESR